MKVFKLNNNTWIYAKTKEQAIEFYIHEEGVSKKEVIDEEEYKELELPDGKLWMDCKYMTEEDKKRKTLKRIRGIMHYEVTFEKAVKRANLKAPCRIARACE